MSQTFMQKMDPVTVQVTGGGLRIDQFLAMQESIKSRSAAQKLLDAGHVLCNGKRVKKSSIKLDTGDTVTFSFPPLASIPDSSLSSVALPVLFEDDFCIVIDKPAGYAVHEGHGMKKAEVTILSALQPLFSERKLPYASSEILVHRLDRETTGCLLIAKTPVAHMKLQKQFAERTVEKTYLTLVAGIPYPASAIIDAPIGRHAQERTKMSVYQSTASRTARTTYRTLGITDDATLLACDLHTGRTHQIRVHLRSIGHPVLGDQSYSSGQSDSITQKYDINFLCLHAWKLSFLSLSGKKVHVMSKLPENFMALLKRIKIELPISAGATKVIESA